MNNDSPLSDTAFFVRARALYYSARGQGLFKNNTITKQLSLLCNAFYQHTWGYKFGKNRVTKDALMVDIPKPFILLAGISGTGKTRFVREQAKLTGDINETYSLIPVRPDWHDPSDLLGYISRLGVEAEYVVTDTLEFVIRAWKDIADRGLSFDNGELGWGNATPDNHKVRPFWLCLDEMNLAPVEQYFADYLSVLETRKWANANELATGEPIYQCEALVKPQMIEQLSKTRQQKLKADLKLADPGYQKLWDYFICKGIPLPFNLIVVGTVNMDETTHAFSRKVIDRALTFDFGVFFPNDFAHFFHAPHKIKPLGFPQLSHVTEQDLSSVKADPSGQKSIVFLTQVNAVLKHSPFELAYRALSELLLAVFCFKPKDEAELQAVWDDFLMCKLFPRIDGDAHKLRPLLTELAQQLKAQLHLIWDATRIELLLTGDEVTAKALTTSCRSKIKLDWMSARLEHNGFTSFWP